MALVQIGRFADPNEGEIAANALRAEGIEAVFNSEGLATTDFLLRNAAGGYPLWVLSDEVDEARRLLRDIARSAPARFSGGDREAEDDEDGGLEDRRRRSRRFRLGILLAIFIAPLAMALIFMIASVLWPSY